MKKKSRIFIVDDHAIIREGLTMIINQEEDFEVCGQSEDAAKALKMIKELKPDLVIIDITLKDSSGIELVSDLKRVECDIPALILSMHDESFYADRAIKAGARGYVMKQETYKNLIKAIRKILSGKIYLSEKMTDRMLNSLSSSQKEPGLSPMERLSKRELEVFELIGQGLSTREIAENIFLSKKTIGAYKEKIKQKLGLKNAAELSRNAFNWFENL